MSDEKNHPEAENDEGVDSPNAVRSNRPPEGNLDDWGGVTEPINVQPSDLGIEDDEETSLETPSTEEEIFALLNRDKYTLDKERFSDDGNSFKLSQKSWLMRVEGESEKPSDIWIFETDKDEQEDWKRVDKLGNTKSLISDPQIKSGSKLQFNQLEYKVFVSPKDGSLIVGKKPNPQTNG